MNRIIFINILLWFCLSLYLLAANLGFFGVGFVYSSEKYSPWRSHLWPRANYEILEDGILLKQSTWLDLHLPVRFRSVQVKVVADNSENLELVWKEKVDGEALLFSKLNDDGVVQVNLENLSGLNYLVFSIPENMEIKIESLKIDFSEALWFYDFKKNMLK